MHMTRPRLQPLNSVHKLLPPNLQTVRLLTPGELAQILGISVQTVYNRCSTGGSLPRVVYVGRLPRFVESEVVAWIRKLPTVASPEVGDSEQDKSPAAPRRPGRPTKAEQVMRRRLIRS